MRKHHAEKAPVPYRPGRWMPPLEAEMENLFGRLMAPAGRMPGWPSRFGLQETEMPDPVVDIFLEGGDIVVKAEVPGMKRDDLEVRLDHGRLVIRGEKHKEEKTERKNYFRMERSYGAFSRFIDLPCEVRQEKVKATFKDGVLEIRLPKTDEAKKREVKIKIEG